MILTRIPLRRLGEAESSIEHLNQDGAWIKGLDWEHATVVMDKGATEMSVRYHAAQKQWVALQRKNGFASSEVIVRTAPELSGPWSAPRTMFRFPEMTAGAAQFDKNTFCCAAKEQSQLQSSPGNIVFTYVCNSSNFGKQIVNMAIYRPQIAASQLQ